MRTIKRRYILILIAFLALAIIKPVFFLRIKQIVLETLSIPLRLIRHIDKNIRTGSSYRRENADLKEKLAMLTLELSLNSNVLRENENYRSLLDFKAKLPFKAIACEVIGTAPSSWTRAIWINKGSSDGIKKKMAACTLNGLVGTVVETTPHTSQVMLITDPNSRVGVMLEKSRQAGVLTGSQEDKCRIIYLDIDSDVKKGEKVITSGFGNFFQKGITVGVVTDIGWEKKGFYKYAVVRPAQDMKSMEAVLCIE